MITYIILESINKGMLTNLRPVCWEKKGVMRQFNKKEDAIRAVLMFPANRYYYIVEVDISTPEKLTYVQFPCY